MDNSFDNDPLTGMIDIRIGDNRWHQFDSQDDNWVYT